MKHLLLILSIGVVILSACRKREIADPSYMHITAVEQNSMPGQGTNNHDIRYVYTLINDNSIGTYETPNTVPVLYSGTYTVEARPMIKWLARDGFHPYSMMKTYSQVLDLELLQVDTLRPVFEYQDNVEFAWMEDFNDNDASLQIRGGTFDTFYVKPPDTASFDGTPYMEINMGNGEQFFEIETKDLFSIPTDGREVILELNYKCNVPFTIGVYATTQSQVITIPSVTPFSTQGKWLKGYIYLTDEVFNQGSNTRFRIFIRSANASVVDPIIYFDNFKLLYRKS
ncbi:MAG: hypothetical protein LPK45_02995 [Bacteroidota bacterium]|nr:hypothetical protein [Bacteroidota bacterium]MDX5430007.1 hypothetical protein [Bacteroidota bacterium]MDX5468780.1 hypothetical protein [Bacteroidota bacterium]